jgi:hypothetical protein
MFTFRQVHWLPVFNKMVSTEVMRAGVCVAFALLLSEISTLLGKGEEKDLFA